MTEAENFALKIEKSCHVQNPAKILPKREVFAKEQRRGKFRGNLSEGA